MSYKLSSIKLEHTQAVVSLVEELYAKEGLLTGFNPEKVCTILHHCLFYPKDYFACILLKEEEVVGAIVAVSSINPFGNQKIATELIWFVKEEHRGRHSLEMVNRLENWARDEAKAEFLSFGHSASLRDLGKLLERRGYQKQEIIYQKKL